MGPCRLRPPTGNMDAGSRAPPAPSLSGCGDTSCNRFTRGGGAAPGVSLRDRCSSTDREKSRAAAVRMLHGRAPRPARGDRTEPPRA
jgi:hypothetical protein